MEVKAGYKQTEVGMIPDDWEVKSLYSISEKIMVGIASAATHAYRDKGIVMFRNQNIKPGFLDDSDILYISPEYEIAFKNKRLKSGDLLTARTGYPGTTTIVPDQYNGSQSFTTLITRPNRQLIEPKYLCCYINSSSGQSYFEQNQIGGGQKNVNAGSLKLMPIPVPPTKAEQEAIAEALSDADALIASLEQLIVKKRSIKQGAMQALLTGKQRLPGFEVKPGYQQTEVGEIPTDWEIQCLDDVADIDVENLGSNTSRSFEFNYISLEDIDVGSLKSYSNQIFCSAPSRARRKLRSGDIMVSTVRPNLLSHYLFEIPKGEWICSTGFSVVRCKYHFAQPKFIYAHFFASVIIRQIDSLLTGSNYPAINGKDVKSLRFPIPPLPEQSAIAAILSDMDDEIAVLETKLDKAKQIKQGMMQELLTGRIRLV